MSKVAWLFIVLAVLVVAAGISFALLVSDQNVQRIAAAANLMLLGGLLIVTVIYADRTGAIAKGTEKLAKVAEEQRLALWEPWIQPYVRYPTLVATAPGSQIQVLYPNTGKGDAYEVRSVILLDCTAQDFEQALDQGKHPFQFPQQWIGPQWPHIPAGLPQEWFCDPPPNLANHVAVVMYKDRFGRQFVSGYGFRMENNELRTLKAIPPRLFKEVLSS